MSDTDTGHGLADMPMFKQILIVIDAHPATRAAVDEGLALAVKHGAEVVFFHAMPKYTVPPPDTPTFDAMSHEDFHRAALAAANLLFTKATQAADEAGVASRRVTAEGDGDARRVVEAAQALQCDLIVVAATGRGALLRLLTGSVIPGLITSSPVPLLIVKDHASARDAAEAAADEPADTPGNPASVASGTTVPADKTAPRAMVILDAGEHGPCAVELGIAWARHADAAEVVFVDIPQDREANPPDPQGLPSGAGDGLSHALLVLAHRRQAEAIAAATRQGVRAMSISIASPHDIASAADNQHCDVIVLASPGGNAVLRLLSGNLVPKVISDAHVPVLVCPSTRSERVDTTNASSSH